MIWPESLKNKGAESSLKFYRPVKKTTLKV